MKQKIDRHIFWFCGVSLKSVYNRYAEVNGINPQHSGAMLATSDHFLKYLFHDVEDTSSKPLLLFPIDEGPHCCYN